MHSLLLPHTDTPAPRIQLHGYQLYAVERWIIQRTRPVVCLVVHTGDPAHTVDLAVCNEDDAHDILPVLRADGAKPRQTAYGIVMVTSLAHFRSDYNIVHVPGGHYLAVRDHLYANINLLRMGFSGRTALTLEDPSDSTKDRFLVAYGFPETPDSPAVSPVRGGRHVSRPSILPPKHLRRERPAFVTTVLELVRLIQAALSIFGLFTPAPDGLLCDVTELAIRTWITHYGTPFANLEPSDRIAEPAFVCALFSLVLAVRNKLLHLGYSALPRDPFISPQQFSQALARSAQPLYSHQNHPSHALILAAPGLPVATFVQQPIPLSAVNSTSSIGTSLSVDIIDCINSAYDAKSKPDHGKVRRAIKNRLASPDSDGGIEETRRGTADGPSDRTALPSGSIGIGSSGGQIFTGIATGLGLSATNSGTTVSDIITPTADLTTFLRVLAAKETITTRARRHREARRESNDFNNETTVAGSLKALWSGRLNDLARLREAEQEKRTRKVSSIGSDREKSSIRRPGSALSDDEIERRGKVRYDGKSTEDESESHFGGVLSGKVRGKLGSWASLANRRKHQSVDLSPKPPSKERPSRLNIPSGRPSITRRSTANSRAQSPILPPFADCEDEDVLSSGQVSPLSDHRMNLPLIGSGSKGVNTSSPQLHYLQPHDSESTLSRLLARKKPWAQRRLSGSTRVSSWADPLSAREGVAVDPESGDGSGTESKRRKDELDTELDSDVSANPSLLGRDQSLPVVPSLSDSLSSRWRRKEKARFHSLLSVVDGDGFMGEAPLDEEDEDDGETVDDDDSDRETFSVPGQSWRGPRRRWSFHDLEDFDGEAVEVLDVERMKIDVNLCGQLLVMRRREDQMKYMMMCMKHLLQSINTTNEFVREHYETHFEPLTEIEARSGILLEIDEEYLRSTQSTQATNALRYEAEQFHVNQLWHNVSQSRRKVLAMREKVFGMGGRRLPAGVHGAHGAFNRLQWTVDGQERLVDNLGRTESEVEEENRVDKSLAMDVEEEVGDEDVVEHPGMKPMWLLRFFTGWSARWSAAAAAPPTPGDDPAKKAEKDPTPEQPTQLIAGQSTGITL